MQLIIDLVEHLKECTRIPAALICKICLNSTILFRDDQGTRRVMVDVGVETYGPNGKATAHLHAELTGQEDETWLVSGGVEVGMAFVVRFSVSFQYVIDGRGNVGVATTIFVGAGTPNAHIRIIGSLA